MRLGRANNSNTKIKQNNEKAALQYESGYQLQKRDYLGKTTKTMKWDISS